MTSALLAFAGIGFLVGFRHAFEPDHLAAVSTFATRSRGWRGAAGLGVAWGIGHTVSVGAVALCLVGLGVQLPPPVFRSFELLVAALLIGLGVATLLADRRAHRAALDPAQAAAHAGASAHQHPVPLRHARGAFGFGVAHGLAGSGAVIVLLVAAATTPRAQALYLAAFGLGTIGGMSVVSLLVGGIAGAAAGRGTAWIRAVRLAAAIVSIVVGTLLGASVLHGVHFSSKTTSPVGVTRKTYVSFRSSRPLCVATSTRSPSVRTCTMPKTVFS